MHVGGENRIASLQAAGQLKTRHNASASLSSFLSHLLLSARASPLCLFRILFRILSFCSVNPTSLAQPFYFAISFPRRCSFFFFSTLFVLLWHTGWLISVPPRPSFFQPLPGLSSHPRPFDVAPRPSCNCFDSLRLSFLLVLSICPSISFSLSSPLFYFTFLPDSSISFAPDSDSAQRVSTAKSIDRNVPKRTNESSKRAREEQSEQITDGIGDDRG